MLIAAPEIHTDLLWDLTMLFVIVCALYFGVIFFFRRKLTLGSKSNRKRKKELSPMISEFLFYDEDASKEEKTNYVNLKIEIRELLNDDFNRKVLIDILMDLRKDLSGATLRKLFELYQGLGLHHDSYKKLESWRWHAISKGILELTQMHVEESYGFVTKFINDKRSTIRKQAEMAIITLNDEGLNYFLDTTTYRISEWQQLKILEVLKNKSDFQPPSFKHWLISKNKDVVLFALRLMGHYNQSDGNQALIELLKHKKSEIKAAAIDCIKEFHVVEAVETLKLVFWNSTVDIKINILDALASLGNTSDIEFLESIAAKESNFNVKSKASATINAIVPMSVMPTMDIQSDDNFEVPADIPIETIEENGNENPTVDHEIEENFEIEEEIVPDSMEISQPAVSAPLDDNITKGFEEEVVQESIEIEHEEFPIENSEEKEIVTTPTFKMDFLPLVTEEAKNIIKYEYKKDQEELVSEELFNIETIFEILEQNPVPSTENKESREEMPSAEEKDFSLKSPEIDFLPIVTSETKTGVPYKFVKKQDERIVVQELFDIEADFEVLEQQDSKGIDNEPPWEETPAAAEKEMDFSLKSSMFDFLPIVIAPEVEIEQNASVDKIAPISPFDIPVVYSEVKIVTPEAKANKILSELNELVPLPATPKPEDQTYYKKKLHQDSKEPTSINTIDMKKIKKIKCKGVEIKTENQEIVQETKDEMESVVYDDFDEETNSGEQNTLDWILAENQAQGELKQKIKTIVKAQKVSAIKLPKPIFYSEQETNTLALLDDIEALGDAREVPLLQGMLLDQNTSSFHNRIQSLIVKISDTSVLKREPVIHDNKDGFSVFEEFFRTADTESKLILLDEIVAVGDEKEVAFLEWLIENSEIKVQKKATICLEGLTAKLAQEANEEQSEPSGIEEKSSQNGVKTNEHQSVLTSKIDEISKEKPFSVFDIDFEIDIENPEEFEQKPK